VDDNQRSERVTAGPGHVQAHTIPRFGIRQAFDARVAVLQSFIDLDAGGHEPAKGKQGRQHLIRPFRQLDPLRRQPKGALGIGAAAVVRHALSRRNGLLLGPEKEAADRATSSANLDRLPAFKQRPSTATETPGLHRLGSWREACWRMQHEAVRCGREASGEHSNEGDDPQDMRGHPQKLFPPTLPPPQPPPTRRLKLPPIRLLYTAASGTFEVFGGSSEV